MKRFLFLIPLLMLAPATHAQESDNRATMERMDRLERDLMLMQRQSSRAQSGTYSTGSNYPPVTGTANGQTEVRLQQMEEQMRRIQGEIEEAKFQNKQTGDKLDKFMTDAQYRLGALEQKAPVATAPAAPPAAAPASTSGTLIAPPESADEETPENEEDAAPKPQPKTEAAPAFKTSKEEYNYAFKLLRQAKHDEAAKAFEQFIRNHPKDPLVGNAYYWLGETYYVQRDYTKSADQFRLGYKANATGPKAGDNLLKLAMSLSAQNKPKDACVVLGEVVKKFGDKTTMKQKAQAEIERNKCS